MKPIAISKRFAVRMSFLFLLCIGATIHQSSLAKWQADLAERQATANEQKQNEQNSRERSKALNSESAIALDRVKQGCQSIVLTQNNKPARFQEDLRVFDAQTFPSDPKIPRFDKQGNPINGVKPLPEGLSICNEFGDTAIVARNGAISDIKRVSPAQLSEFLTHFNQLKSRINP